ncbi:MAG TPA: glycosyltransferase family 9 protein, partial [Bacteroidota bacterium]|nr:glycosyltransferase family 9 protein [Bacteroidota bacterium]
MHPPSKILIIRFSSIGDIVLTNPVIRFLRKQFPGARLDFLTKKRYADLLRWNADLSNVILLESDDDGGLGQLRRKIREIRYDLIVDLHNSLRSRYLRTFAGARSVRVVNKHAIRRSLLVVFKKNLFKNVRSVPDRYCDTVRRFGDPDTRVDFPLPGEIVETATGLMYAGKFTVNDRIVGFAPSAAYFSKRWPMDRFVKLGKSLASSDSVKIIIFGSADDTEMCADIAHLVNSGAGAHCAENYAGRLSLAETAVVAGHCSVFVTNDTGVMHLAAARGARVVALFGSSVREFGFSPQGEGNVVLESRGLEC